MSRNPRREREWVDRVAVGVAVVWMGFLLVGVSNCLPIKPPAEPTEPQTPLGWATQWHDNIQVLGERVRDELIRHPRGLYRMGGAHESLADVAAGGKGGGRRTASRSPAASAADQRDARSASAAIAGARCGLTKEDRRRGLGKPVGGWLRIAR